MADLSEESASEMARILRSSLETFLRRRSPVFSMQEVDRVQPATGELPADVVLPMVFAGFSETTVEGCLFVTYLKPNVYHVSVKVGGSAYRSWILQACSQCKSEPLSRIYTHHLWFHVLRELKDRASAEVDVGRTTAELG